ncbi:MAG: Rnase Y domain-containing protein, partial [Oscillospiraceae bacterium]|nr:Rnase Y domain-containing protein [Oscillospiraceae bacterium]
MVISIWIFVAVSAVLLLAGAGMYFLGHKKGEEHRKLVAEQKIGSAEAESARILNDALAAAENKKKEAVLEAKDEIHRYRQEAERELRERRAEVQRQERRINQREETLDKRSDNLEKKEDALQAKVKAADARLDEIETIKKSQFDMLERISGFTEEQAKQHLLQALEGDLEHEKALR